MAKVAIRGARRRSQDFESLWLITFADLMVQLMAFFAVIYAFSAQDERQLRELLRNVQQTLGLSSGALQGPGILPGSTGLDPNRAADLERLLSDLKAQDGRDAGTRLRVVSFRGSLLFEEGSDAIDATFARVVEHLAGLVKQYPGFSMVCEGHAAPGEKGRGGSDALEVSGRRAQATVRALVAQGVDPRWLAAEARGDATPEGDPASPEGRALQRRVVFRFQRPAER